MDYLKKNRAIGLLVAFVLAFGLSYSFDPDSGLSTALMGLGLVQGLIVVCMSHWIRKQIMPGIDFHDLWLKAREHPIGAGLVLVAMAQIFVGLLGVFSPRAHAATLPDGFAVYGPILKNEQQRFWPDHPAPHFLAGLIEQESCVSLRSKKCWNPSARLKNAREEGAGMGQITRAYSANGKLRFDSLAGMVSQYDDLRGWNWSNVYVRPDYQLRAVVLMSRDAAKRYRNLPGKLAFGDAAYNGGARDVARERQACGLTAGCDPALWFGHVERHCKKSRQPLYGGRSACDINREHVHNVMHVRSAKYAPFFDGGRL